MRCGLEPGARVADLGSGTGIFTRALLEAGALVHAVEPNQAMRAVAEQELATFPLLRSREACAEQTGLPSGSVDLVTMAQAFHWFDQARVRSEVARILRPGGRSAIIWNDRMRVRPFLSAYEDLIRRYSDDYQLVDHRRIDDAQLSAFFHPGQFMSQHVPNRQSLDFHGLCGRLLSSSYAPMEGHPQHLPMMDELARLFARFAQDGRIEILYDTVLHHGLGPRLG